MLRDRGFDILKGKRVGLITNPTGISADLEQTADILHRAPGVKLVALFGPEHGVRGDVEGGKEINGFNDAQTGLPVYSLYGRTRKPTKDMLRGIDVLVYDIQDIGVRSYTYISTLGLAMEAAAENNVTFVVLDRPDPLTGQRVEGDDARSSTIKSFIGAYQIPYVYGMTAGELAEMINLEGWLAERREVQSRRRSDGRVETLDVVGPNRPGVGTDISAYTPRNDADVLCHDGTAGRTRDGKPGSRIHHFRSSLSAHPGWMVKSSPRISISNVSAVSNFVLFPIGRSILTRPVPGFSAFRST